MKTIAIMNNKGGVGKTVTAINLADILVREYHKRVVLADCDGQMNLTRFFFPEFDPANGLATVAEVLTGESEPVWCDNLVEVREGLDILPGSPALYDLDLLAIRDGLGDTYELVRFCAAAEKDGETDFFVLDCPPGYTLASVSALIAADEVVVPMLVDGFSTAGMAELVRQVDTMRQVNPRLRVAGILATQYQRTAEEREIHRLLFLESGLPVFETMIRMSKPVPRSIAARESILTFSPYCGASKDYRAFVREYLEGRHEWF